MRLASFREFGAARGVGTARAKAVLACAVLGVPFPLAAVPDTTAVHPATLIVGGGVAGIQAALEIADAGKQVYLVERTGTIGGHMAMFDKTFPTLDCAACILTPKMVAVGQHEIIDLMTYAEVDDVSGQPGDYKVKVRKKATPRRRRRLRRLPRLRGGLPRARAERVRQRHRRTQGDLHAVPAGGAQRLPHRRASLHLRAERRRQVRRLRQEVPQGVHRPRRRPTRLVELEVGNIILATGYDVYDATKIERYGYGTYPNVLTALEFERLTNASGPTGGKIVMKTKRFNKRKKADEWVFDADEGSAPRSVAIIHCVGSRDANHNAYCSRVCCMYSLKFAHLVKEKLPDADCYEFYIDMRAFGKGYEEFADRIKAEGTFVVRGRTAKVIETDGQMVDPRRGHRQASSWSSSPSTWSCSPSASSPAHGTAELAQMLGLAVDSDGWFSELDYNADPTDTERGGISVAGACQAPKDIPDTVAQASAVAAGVLKSIATGRGLDSRADLSLADIEARAANLIRV